MKSKENPCILYRPCVLVDHAAYTTARGTRLAVKNLAGILAGVEEDATPRLREMASGGKRKRAERRRATVPLDSLGKRGGVGFCSLLV